MKVKFILILFLTILMACSAYKQLKPKPEIVALEAGYTQLLNKDKSFHLKPGKKYYMEFPPIQGDNFFLVLNVSNISAINSHLTGLFTKGKGDTPIPDESSDDDDLLVYKLDRSGTVFTWVIENVTQELELDMDYRYVPIWRFRFESKNSEFQTVLAKNTVERENYHALGVSITPDDLNFDKDLHNIRSSIDNLKAVQGELLEIEAIFPPDIRMSDDKAYLDYTGLKQELEDEIKFQTDYSNTLSFFKIEKESRSSDKIFIQSLPEFSSYFAGVENYPQNVIQEARRVLGDRLSIIDGYFDRQLKNKRDISQITFPIDEIDALFTACQQQPGYQFKSISSFVTTFNQNVNSLDEARTGLDSINAQVTGVWPADSFYRDLIPELRQLKSKLPNASSNYGQYSNLSSVSKLNAEVKSINKKVSATQRNFDKAARLVPRINASHTNFDYYEIIRILKQNRHLGFLVKQYPDVDQLSLDYQTEQIAEAYNSRQWATAEQRLRALFNDRNFLNYNATAAKKSKVQRRYENKLVTAIERESKERINRFIEANMGAYQNVENLYNDVAFQPVYVLTFSAGGNNIVNAYNKKVQDYLDSFKYVQFPGKSIEKIYKSFTANIRDNGVAKARAVSIHGKYYRGENKKIKNLVAECNPLIPKWITKPKSYRKVYVLPTNATRQSSNEYVFRLNIRIPSQAKFPVFDVNIKLPREVARSAGSQQWYQKITINDNVLKNEGRFTITAPTKSNNYECQITPVQMKKTGDNILEVRFSYQDFKVLEVSIMAQRPIMKKN